MRFLLTACEAAAQRGHLAPTGTEDCKSPNCAYFLAGPIPGPHCCGQAPDGQNPSVVRRMRGRQR